MHLDGTVGANLERKSFTRMGLAHCVLLRYPYAQGVLSEQGRVLSEQISELTYNAHWSGQAAQRHAQFY